MKILKQKIETYCRYWRFKNYEIPEIKKYIANYLTNILKKDSDLIPVRMSATYVSLRKPDDTNFQDGLDVQVDWFSELKVFEDTINPPPAFSLIEWLLSDALRSFVKGELRVFSRRNFENYYFYFDYHNSAAHKQAEALLEKYQNIAFHTQSYHFISSIKKNNTICFNNNRFDSATPKEIAKLLYDIERLSAKTQL